VSRTLVVQSHRQPLPHPWLDDCLASVAVWAARRGYDYRWLDDALFDVLPRELRQRLAEMPVVASDLARLEVLAAALEEGYDTVVWWDADTLIFAPERLVLPDAAYAVGREVWLQPLTGSPRVYVKVHNAFLMFRRGNPFLSFYRHAAVRILRAHEGPMVPQLVGPKLLTALNNLMGLPVLEGAAVLSPRLLRALTDERTAPAAVRDRERVLALFRRRSPEAPAAFNLCGSSVRRGEVDDAALTAFCETPERWLRRMIDGWDPS